MLQLNKVIRLKKVHSDRGYQIINTNNLHMEYIQVRAMADEIKQD